MNKLKIIKDILGFRYDYSKTASFILRNENMVLVAQSAMSAINSFNELSILDNFKILKKGGDGRMVFRVNTSQLKRETFVVKTCSLNRFKHRLTYPAMKTHTLGFSEAANLIIAANRGINVPKIYGYGSISDFFRMTKMTIVILENLRGYTTVEKLLELNKGDDNKCAEIICRTIPVFVDLYKAKCNNIEINLHGIMLANRNSKPDAFILDFENAVFHNKSSLEILIFEAASLVKWSPNLLSEKVITDWLAKLLNAVNIKDKVVRKRLVERFNYYRITKLHRKHRRIIC